MKLIFAICAMLALPSIRDFAADAEESDLRFPVLRIPHPQQRIYKAAETDFEIVAPKDSDSVAASNKEILRKLATIRLPKFAFHNAPAREVFTWLTTQSYERDPKQQGIKFIFDLSVVADDTHHPLQDRLGASLDFSVSDISLGEALRYVSSLLNLRMRIEDGVIHVSILSWE